jgi:hypothetical protein
MSHTRIIGDARNKLQDASRDLLGVQVYTNSQELADELAVARAEVDRAVGRLSDVLRVKADA